MCDRDRRAPEPWQSTLRYPPEAWVATMQSLSCIFRGGTMMVRELELSAAALLGSSRAPPVLLSEDRGSGA